MIAATLKPRWQEIFKEEAALKDTLGNVEDSPGRNPLVQRRKHMKCRW